jgi:aminoglycoside phosphotransferase (APT) family kinase protein
LNSHADNIEARLGPDLSALVHAWPAPLASITEITGLPSSTRRRASFCVAFTDGTRLKGRRFETAERAAQVAGFLRRLRDGFPRVRQARGDAVLFEWIEGPVLDSLHPIPADVLVRSGGLLGSLHEIEPTEPVPDPQSAAKERCAKLEQHIELLIAEHALDRARARALCAAALTDAPRFLDCGIVHKDFCAANIVLREARPVSIDNANVAFGPFDLDLARTWDRWPMSAVEWRHFVDGYQRHRSVEWFLAHFFFWAVSALVGSAATRIRARSDRVCTPLERLRMLVDLSEGRANVDPVAFRWPEGAQPVRGRR